MKNSVNGYNFFKAYCFTRDFLFVSVIIFFAISQSAIHSGWILAENAVQGLRERQPHMDKETVSLEVDCVSVGVLLFKASIFEMVQFARFETTDLVG